MSASAYIIQTVRSKSQPSLSAAYNRTSFEGNEVKAAKMEAFGTKNRIRGDEMFLRQC